eukprot:5911946-Pyramimonas_sp.AAC.1
MPKSSTSCITGPTSPLKRLTKMQRYPSSDHDGQEDVFRRCTYFRSKSVSPRAKFYRYQQRVQSVISRPRLLYTMLRGYIIAQLREESTHVYVRAQKASQ